MRRRLAVLLAASTLIGSAFAVAPARTASAQAGQPDFVTGTGDGHNAHVVVYDAGGNALGGFFAFNGATGARVASGDLTGDLQPEIIVASGAGVDSRVTIFSPSGSPIGSFSPYGAFPGGVSITAGDVDGDSVDEIITGAGPGGGPHVVVWDWTGGAATPIHGWYAYDPGFKGGVDVSAFNLVNSARADVVTGPGAGGGPHVRVWDLGSGAAVEDAGWMAYAPGFTGGVNVAAGEIDGVRAVATGPGPGGGPHVRVFSTSGALRNQFYAYNPAFGGGVNVVFSAPQGADFGHLITAPASWGGPHVRGFTASGGELFGFMAYGGHTMNGVNLAAVRRLGTSNNTNQNGTNSSG